MQTWLSGGSTTESEGTTSLMEIHMLEAQQKSICFRSFVLIYIISKHQSYDIYIFSKNENNCGRWFEVSSLLVKYSFPWRGKDFAIPHQQGLGLPAAGAHIHSSQAAVWCKSPQWGPMAGSRTAIPSFELWHSGYVTLFSLTYAELFSAETGEGDVLSELNLKSFDLQELLKSWLPCLTL